MLHPTVLVNAQVDLLRLIPELVTDMGGDADRISAYVDTFPTKVDLTFAIQRMQSPSLLVVWQGTGVGILQKNEVWKHRFSWILRGADPATVFTHSINGIPSDGRGYKMLRHPLHDYAYSMDVPDANRRSLLIGNDTVIDYFEISVSYAEKGDF